MSNIKEQTTVEGHQRKYSLKNTLLPEGYVINKKLLNTLQGSIYIGKHYDGKHKVIIKVSSKKLSNKGITYVNKRKPVTVKEDIVKEAQIMQHIKQNRKKSIKGYIKLLNFINDKYNYIIIQEFGGESLYDHVKYAHSKHRSLDKIFWKKHVNKLFKQMVLFINWLHNTVNVCHFDISLENCVINTNTMTVKFIDYGLSELFPNSNNKFKSKKFKVGKSRYSSPEIYNENECNTYFYADSNDIWALGVCLWCMLTGHILYSKPSLSDIIFCKIITGQLKKVINSWSLSKYLDDNAYDLLTKIFKPEKHRIEMNSIINHEYIKNTKMYRCN